MNSAGGMAGHLGEFDTLAAGAGAVGGPTVVTENARDITDTSAELYGTVNGNGLSTTWDFISNSGLYGPSPPGNLPVGSTPQEVHCTATHLTPSTGYDFRIRATDSAGTTSSGSSLMFTTLAAGPDQQA